jgi:predicted ferric reductase
MAYSLGRGLAWVAAFSILALLPLGIAGIGPIPPVRSYLIEFGVALGFLGLGLLTLQFLCTGRFRWVAPSYGMDNILQYHREMGILGFVMVLAHVVLLTWVEAPFREYFDPRVNFLRTLFLVLALLSLAALLVTTLWRTTFRLPYEWWRLAHGVLALGVVFIGLVHVVQVSHYSDPLWKKVALGVLVVGSMYTLVHTRLVRPWLSRRRPYHVVEVQPERDSSHTLTLEPVGHPGMRFQPGQFAWVTVNPTPFTLQQHPFSFASSARRMELGFTAKELGDFTATWKDIEPGTRAFLEGPFGSFIPEPTSTTGLFLIMGGIGITPAMGMLRTLRDDGDPRPLILIYGNKNWEDVTFREELETLQGELNLKVVHLLEEPPADWEGESGFVDREMLARYVPERRETFQYLICGPAQLMDVAEISLRELGVPWNRIYSERFGIV